MTKPTDRTLTDADVSAIVDRLLGELERRGLLLRRPRAQPPAVESVSEADMATARRIARGMGLTVVEPTERGGPRPRRVGKGRLA